MVKERIFETEWLIYNIEKHKLYNKLHRRFLDIGAGDGQHCSNSMAFIEMGWDALLIDGLETNINKCKKLHIGRPFVKCIQAVLSDKEEMVHFEQDSRFWALSSIDYIKTPNTQTKTLSSILKAHRINNIGVASIDVEGNETNILRDMMDNDIMPQIMIIEANEPWMAEEHRRLLDGSYKIVGGISPNNFFVRNDLKW